MRIKIGRNDSAPKNRQDWRNLRSDKMVKGSGRILWFTYGKVTNIWLAGFYILIQR